MSRSRLARAALEFLRGCRRSAPEIGRGLPSIYAEGTKELDRRVKAAFPVGTPEEEVVAALRGQGFEIDRVRDGLRSATFARTELLVFRTIWSVRWRSEQDRVSDIRGVYGVQAP